MFLLALGARKLSETRFPSQLTRSLEFPFGHRPRTDQPHPTLVPSRSEQRGETARDSPIDERSNQMGRIYDLIDDKLREFLLNQHVFFVATSPNDAKGHINLSPKGLESFRVLDEETVAYADLTGSGAETIAHLKENGRIVLMFCAFMGPPKIVRLHGAGDVIEANQPAFQDLQALFPAFDGLRSIIRIHCHRISDSCGFGVPIMAYQGERDQLTKWALQKGEQGILQYQRKNNQTSIDGLPGLTIEGQEPQG